MRRRQRQLGRFLRHERLSVAMALAEYSHHTSRGQRVARARGVEREENCELAAGVRPNPLSEVRTQDGVSRHAVRNYEHYAPLVQVLDVPVPQPMEIPQRIVDDMLQDMADRVQQRIVPLDELEAVSRLAPPDRTQQRAVEHMGAPVLSLVDGDAVSDRAQQRIVEQCLFEQRTVDPVDVPVPVVVEPVEVQLEQLVDLPAPQRVRIPSVRVPQRTAGQVVDVTDPQIMEDFDIPQAHVQQRTVEQSVGVGGDASSSVQPAPHEDLRFSAAAVDAVEEQFQVFFTLFSSEKKSAEVAAQSSARVHAHSSSSPAAHHDAEVGRDDLWVHIMSDERSYFWRPIGRCHLAFVPAG